MEIIEQSAISENRFSMLLIRSMWLVEEGKAHKDLPSLVYQALPENLIPCKELHNSFYAVFGS